MKLPASFTYRSHAASDTMDARRRTVPPDDHRAKSGFRINLDKKLTQKKKKQTTKTTTTNKKTAQQLLHRH